jgi:hypothetical protein
MLPVIVGTWVRRGGLILSFARSASPRIGSGSWLAASSAAIGLLLVALVSSAAAVSGPTKLLNADVSPRSASPTTSITFTVTYRNRYGDPPVYVRVLIDGAARGMRVADSKLDYHAGVRYRLATTLAKGKHQIAYTASDARKFTDTIQAGTVTIATASGAGAGSGDSGSGGSAGSTDDSTPASSPTGGSTGGSGASPAGTVTDTNHRDASVARYEPPPESDAGLPPIAPVTSPDTSGPAAGQGPGDASGRGAATGGRDRSGAEVSTDPPASAGLATLGAAGGLTPNQRMVVTAISTTTTTVAAMAFLFFGKRRRDGEPPAPDEVLAADAALMTAVPTASVTQPYGGLPSGGEPDEAGMPRWRRPSLMAARKSDPLRAESAATKLSFDDGLVDPLEGRERRRIKYRVVRLLDAPDELRSHEIGLLDEGDEVQLLERSGSFWRVHCPDGSQGWVHRMTLGDIVDVSAGGRADRSFADATDDIDSDVLAAYLRVKGIP